MLDQFIDSCITTAFADKMYDTWAIPGKQDRSSPKQKQGTRAPPPPSGAAYTMTAVLSAEPLVQQVADLCWEQFGAWPLLTHGSIWTSG